MPGGRGGDHNRQWNNPHWDSNAPSAAYNASLRPVANGPAGVQLRGQARELAASWVMLAGQVHAPLTCESVGLECQSACMRGLDSQTRPARLCRWCLTLQRMRRPQRAHPAGAQRLQRAAPPLRPAADCSSCGCATISPAGPAVLAACCTKDQQVGRPEAARPPAWCAALLLADACALACLPGGVATNKVAAPHLHKSLPA